MTKQVTDEAVENACVEAHGEDRWEIHAGWYRRREREIMRRVLEQYEASRTPETSLHKAQRTPAPQGDWVKDAADRAADRMASWSPAKKDYARRATTSAPAVPDPVACAQFPALETTAAMRERLRELSNVSGKDDYDRVVLMLLSDFAKLIAHIAPLGDALARSKSSSWTRYDLAKGLAALGGVTLQDIRSTVGPPDDADAWRIYLARADDLIECMSASSDNARPNAAREWNRRTDPVEERESRHIPEGASCSRREAGLPYPRTCAVCGLGPCHRARKP